MLRNHLRNWAIFLATLTMLLIPHDAQATTTIPLTVNLSETVTVTGTPRITVDVGGTTRYAAYSSGSGTNVLTFTLSPQAGDVDLDGITVSSPIDLNGGSIKDTAGNDATLTFTPPNTAGIKINYPSLSMDFVTDADGRYTLNGTAYNDLTSFLTASGATFSRASVGTYYDSAGSLQTAASGTPRFDWDPVTHAAKGILIEESRTNMLTRSSEFDNAAWTKSIATVTPNLVVAPDGTTTADKFTPTTTFNQHDLLETPTITAGTTYTWSIYAKAAEYHYVGLASYNVTQGYFVAFVVDLSNGATVLGSGTTQYIGNGWYRISTTATPSVATAPYRVKAYPVIPAGISSSASGDGTSGIYVWGAQMEIGSFATSYIPTTSAAVTRSADSLTIPAGGWFNALEGTGHAMFTDPDASTNRAPFAFSDNTANNRIHPYVTSALSFNIYDSGAFQGIGGAYGAFTQGQSMKVNLAYKANDFAGSYNGSAAVTDTSGTVPAVTQLALGRLTNAGYLSDHIQKFLYYPTRLANTQLQLLTQ